MSVDELIDTLLSLDQETRAHAVVCVAKGTGKLHAAQCVSLKSKPTSPLDGHYLILSLSGVEPAGRLLFDKRGEPNG